MPEISSILQGGYHHPLSRQWQAERQLTKVCHYPTPTHHPLIESCKVCPGVPDLRHGQPR
jgi:hypothetical protein